eukprot:GDKI01018454.1.p1 GENE.GDKI01018454.1~~GDKI01018454.1.p1  ORF type:complete len:130 (-),score=20.90 GDKI01018454.1:187-576(-)
MSPSLVSFWKFLLFLAVFCNPLSPLTYMITLPTLTLWALLIAGMFSFFLLFNPLFAVVLGVGVCCVLLVNPLSPAFWLITLPIMCLFSLELMYTVCVYIPLYTLTRWRPDLLTLVPPFFLAHTPNAHTP